MAVTPPGSLPLKSTRQVLGRSCSRHWVARTCSTSLVPMPNASAPNAPWVAVWLSPHTMVIPGWVQPQLRPDDVHDAALRVVQIVQGDAELLAVQPQLAQLAGCHLVPQRQGELAGGGGVVHRRQGALRAAHREPFACASPRTPAVR